LINTESLPLALITGLIGFGLLGAAGSSFIRTQNVTIEDRHGRIVTDLTGILLKGVSAAIAVFLAVQGGLTIFATVGSTGTRPNPYVLLLTCFAAAVFSERIWGKLEEWIIGKQDKNTNAQDNQNGNPPPAPAPPGNGGTPPAPPPPGNGGASAASGQLGSEATPVASGQTQIVNPPPAVGQPENVNTAAPSGASAGQSQSGVQPGTTLDNLPTTGS
jgi:hypothetical protein